MTMFKCEECNKSYYTNRNLREHILTHSGVKPHVCSLCNKSFTRSSYLKIHMRNHMGEAPYSCQHCGKMLSNAGNLKQHLKLHSGVKQFSCQLCDMKFYERHKLRNHARMHSGEMPFLCKSCGKGFSQMGNLNEHEKIHSTDRPFSCFKCSKSFIRKGDLEKHSTTHLSLSLYLCLLCQKGYSRISKLADHVQKAHGQEKCYGCGACGEAFDDIKVISKHTKDFLKSGHCEQQDKHSLCKNGVDEQPLKKISDTDCVNERMSADSPISTMSPLLKENIFKVGNDLLVIEVTTVEQKDEQHSVRSVNEDTSISTSLPTKSLGDKTCGQKIQEFCLDNDNFEYLSCEGLKWKIKYQCGICGKHFKVGKRLEAHVKNHELQKPCDNLKRNGSPESELSSAVNVGCKNSIQNISKESCLETSYKSVSEECFDNDVCKDSLKIVNSNKTLSSSSKDVHSIKNILVRPYVCSICCRGFKQLRGINKHMKSHSSSELSNVSVSFRKPSNAKYSQKQQDDFNVETFGNTCDINVNKVPKESHGTDSPLKELYCVRLDDCVKIELQAIY